MRTIVSYIKPIIGCIALVLVSLGAVVNAFAQQEQMLLPKPKQYKAGTGVLSSQTFAVDAEAHAEAYEALLTQKQYKVGRMYPTRVQVRLVDEIEEARINEREAYRLQIKRDGIVVEATSSAGAYYALQTLRQLLDSAEGKPLQVCEIVDWPSWRIRGLMHDVGRTFIPLEELKKQIALLARFKINVFHWHLTDNQAWRLQSKAFPQLTSIAATERMPGKYYTLSQAKELAEWCKQHEVLLIPELDMPGHSAAFERAMGFGMQTIEGKAALKTLIRELVETIDVPYIHIGTDEVEFTDETFVPEMVSFVRSLGRKVVSWNPGWRYRLGEVDMMQLWSYRGAAERGMPAIDSRLHYINHYDLFADPVALHASRILRLDEGGEDHAGAIIAVWNDRFLPEHKDITAQNNLYASALALADRAWRGGGHGYFDRSASIMTHRRGVLYKDFEDFERRLLHYKRSYFAKEPFPYVAQCHATWLITDPFPNSGNTAMSFPVEDWYLRAVRSGRLAPPAKMPEFVHAGRSYHTKPFVGSGFYLRHVWGEKIAAGVYESPQEQHTAYAMAWVYSPKQQSAGLLFETQNYSRSESDLPPPSGVWDYRNSQIWLNGKAIQAPEWTSRHTKRSHEEPLGNENATARPPIAVQLRSGWNCVLIKLPIDRFTSSEVRLVKWMFTASFVTLDSREALPLRYHTF